MIKKSLNVLFNTQIYLLINRLLLFINFSTSIYLSSRYLSSEEITILLSIMSLIGIIFFLDFGIVNTAQKKLLVNKNNKSFKSEAINFLLISLFNSIFISITLAIFLYFFDINLIFNFTEIQNLNETKKAIYLFIVGFGFQLNNMFFEKYSIVSGNEKKYFSISFYVLVINFFLILVFTHNFTSLSKLIFLNYFFYNFLLMLINYFDFIKKSSLRRFDKLKTIKNYLLQIRQDLFKFFCISISTIFCFGIDPYLISYYFGVESSGSYTIMQRLFQFLIIPILIFNGPITKFYVSINNSIDTKKIIKFIIFITIFLYIFFYIFLIFFGKSIIGFWTNDKILISSLMIIAFSLRSLSEALMINLTNYLNSKDLIKKQFIFSIVMILIAIPVKILIIKNYDIEIMLIAFSFIYMIIFSLIYYFGPNEK